VFLAVGMQDPVLELLVMRSLARMWRNGYYYLEIEEAGILYRTGELKLRGWRLGS
jgi:hypothetical protein